MPLFKLQESGQFQPFEPTPFPELESQLENWIEANPHMLLDGKELVIIARQPRTSFGKILDLLALDHTGATVVIELKRGQAPREVVAQAVEYAAWVDSLSYAELDEIARAYLRSKGRDAGLEQLYESTFAEDDEGNTAEATVSSSSITFNNRQRIIILAEEFSPELEQSLRYLRTRHNMDISAVVFTVHKAGEDTLVSTTPLVGREQSSANSTPRPASKRPYHPFFNRLRDQLQAEHGFPHWTIGRSWMNADSPVSGVKYGASFARGGRVRVDLYIDTHDQIKNKALFDGFFQCRAQIDDAYGKALQWERLDDKIACKIADYREGHISEDEEGLQAIAEWMTDSLVKIRHNVIPLING